MGLSITRIVVTLVDDIVKGERAGASTLTQQLTRKLFLTDEKTWERKIKEALLAIQIEKRYTKNEIITLYCNQIPWGHGTYGAEAAARLYFNKSAKDVTLDEAALLAGIIQAPARHSPYVNPAERAAPAQLRARSHGRRRLHHARAGRRGAQSVPWWPPDVPISMPRRRSSSSSVRQHLEEKFGARQLYENGLAVYTHARRPAAARGRDAPSRTDCGDWTSDAGSVGHRTSSRQGQIVAGYRTMRGVTTPSRRHAVPALVTDVDGTRAAVRVGTLTGELSRDSTTVDRANVRVVSEGRGSPRTARHGGERGTDVSPARSIRRPRPRRHWSRYRTAPDRVLAMVGGRSFERSRFNRATQAMRQLGSTFKPIVFAAAIDRGFTPVSILHDDPVAYPVGPGQPPYAPLNYDKAFEGPITLRHALEQSRNVPTVRLMEQVGPSQVISYAERLGFSSKVQPFLSSALGSSEATLLEVTRALSRCSRTRACA